jgi:hypothetical protein
MTLKIVARTAKSRIRDTSAKPLELAADDVARAFGARRLDVGQSSDPSFFRLAHVRDELARRLRSSGGRPGLSAVEQRRKIPVLESDWEGVQVIAERVAHARFKPSPAQVASILLHMALEHFSEGDVRQRLASIDEGERR